MVDTVLIPLAYISPFTIFGFSVAYFGIVNFVLKSKLPDKAAFNAYTIAWALGSFICVATFGTAVPEHLDAVLVITMTVSGIVLCFAHQM